MTHEAPRSMAAHLALSAMGERLGGFISGTLVVLAVVVAGAKAYPHGAGHIIVLVVATSLTLWLAQVYAHGVAHAVAHDQHLSLAEVRRIARRNRSVVEAALPPVVALLLGAVGVVSTPVAVWAALGLGVVVLGAQGITVARVERLGWLGTLVVVAVNLGLGAVMIALKLLLSH